MIMRRLQTCLCVTFYVFVKFLNSYLTLFKICAKYRTVSLQISNGQGEYAELQPKKTRAPRTAKLNQGKSKALKMTVSSEMYAAIDHRL